jgi:Tol biopolymer transport system component
LKGTYWRFTVRARLACLSSVLALSACSDGGTSPDATGSVEVGTTTTGVALDQNGYVLEVVGTPALRPIQSDEILTLPEVAVGDAELRLSGIRGNCRVHGGHPRRVRIVAGDTVATHFYVICDSLPLRGRILFTDDRGPAPEIYSMNPDGSDQRRLTETQEGEFDPSMSSEGGRILYRRTGRAVSGETLTEIVVMDAVGRVASVTSGGEHPTWSPDGSRILFDMPAGPLGHTDIWVMNADGTSLTNLTNTGTEIEKEPIWSPDGRRILFTADLPRLEIMNADGTGRRPLIEGSGQSAAGTWSPNGSRIAFIAPEGLGFRLFTVREDGSDRIALTPEGTTTESAASWSPAGDRLAFLSPVNGEEDVFVIQADGTGMTNISNTPGVDEDLGPEAWAP